MITQNRLALFEVMLLPSVEEEPYLALALSLQMSLLSFIQHTDAFFEDSACISRLPDCKRIQANLRST